MAMSPATPTLTITPDTAFAIVEKARQFDVKIPQSDPDSGSNPSDDGSIDALEFGTHDDTLNELVGAISDCNDDEQQDLIALVLIGRGDFALDEWPAARAAWADIGRAGIARFLTGIPLLSDYLEDGLSQFDETIADYFDRH
ncbi:DUF3775 domain-containing protein [Novosphingobium sp.]|uniref:DUF3775 domain-containing protein n=1 Tax=Novosphingobium sp. TaxID=1874826 RepID=UPI00334056F4